MERSEAISNQIAQSPDLKGWGDVLENALQAQMSRRVGFRMLLGLPLAVILSGCSMEGFDNDSATPVRRSRRFTEQGDDPDFMIEYTPQTSFAVKDLHMIQEGPPQDSRGELTEAVEFMVDAGCEIEDLTEVLKDINSRTTALTQRFEHRFDVKEDNIDECLTALEESLS